VGLLLAKCGVKLYGNVPPPDLVGIKAPQEQKNYFNLPDGESLAWELSSFDFQSPFPFDDSSFDLVTAFEVIEHISDDPRSVLREIKRVLKKEGYLYISTPNICSMEKILRLFNHAAPYDSKPYSQNFGHRHFMCHIYEYTPWELKDFLQSEGFEMLSMRTWNPYATDPNILRVCLLKVLFSISLFISGYCKAGLLAYIRRGHQIGMLSRKTL